VTVSPDGFGILGIVPMLGRLPVETERELLLSERYWRTAFGADPDIVGTTLRAGGRALRIVGVARLPSGFPGDVDVVDVGEHGDTEDREFRVFETIARVRTGHSMAEAEAEANAFVAALARVHPEHRGWGVEAVVLADDLVRPFRGVLALFLAAGAIFLLLAGVNVMGLVAARRVEGRRDRSIRLAVGASEGRLLRASLIESHLLALVGSVAGVVGAYWLMGPTRAKVPFDVPRLAEAAITPRLVLAGISVGVVAGMVLGLSGYLVSRGAKPSVGRAPVWRAFGAGGRRALVVGQVALTTLLTAAGVAILHRVATLKAIELGFEPDGVSIASTLLPDRAEYDRWRVARAILDGLDAREIHAAMALNTPMSGGHIPLTDDAIPQPAMRANAASVQVVYDLHLVSPEYFSVMGIELLAGRDFGSQDHASSQRVAIVSEEFVTRYFSADTPIESVIGRVIAPLIFEQAGPLVVGVVESIRHDGPDMPVEPEIYSPLSQLALNAMSLVVRGEPDEVAAAVSAVVSQVIPGIPWTPLTPYETQLNEWFAPLRLQIITIGGLSVLGLLLASLGLFSAMAYQVASQRHELGIRKAVGATNGRLMRNVMGSGLTMAAAGALIGLSVWYALLPRSRALVDGIHASGSLVPVSVVAIVGLASVLATLVPALRVTQVDPLVTLKAD
jgi:putative ABC transport system permease protein